MSVFGVPFKQPFQVLRSSDWNALVSAVDYVYMMNYYLSETVQSELTSGQFTPYFDELYTAGSAFFGNEIYVEGYKVLHDLDPIYIAQFLQGAINQIYNYISVYLINIQNTVQQVQGTVQQLQNTVQQVQTTVQNIKLYVSPTALMSIVVPVLSTATTLVSTSTPIKRALLYVTQDTAYVVYVGGASGQHFPIFPGTQIEIDVCDAIQIYLRSENYSYVRALLELTSSSTCN
jgi:hypothetical protein